MRGSSGDDTTGRYLLRRGVDASKDQAYFLFSLTQEQLAGAMFPVGDMPKAAVRQYARDRGLPVADKPDSQEICFIPDDDYASFVAARAPEAAVGGTIVDESGQVLGRHGGIHRYTVGQRKGLGLSAPPTGPNGAGPHAAVRARPSARRSTGRRRIARRSRAHDPDGFSGELDFRSARGRDAG